MHRDQDFDAKQKLPPNEAALTQDLELETLFDAMAQENTFLYQVAKQAVLSGLNDPSAICYRQDILKDVLNNAAVVREIYGIPIESIEIKQKNWMGIYSNDPSGILSGAIKMLEMFVVLL